MNIFWLRCAAALYSLGLLQTIQIVLRRRAHMYPFVLGSFCVGVVLHMVSLVETSMAYRHFPATNFYESVSLCAFLIAVLFLFILWRYDFKSLSICLFPLIFLMTLIGAMEFPVASWATRTTRDAWLAVHVLSVLLGYAALLLTAVASIFYLLQERQLKSKKTIPLFERLPPLATLDNLISISMGFGFALLTFGTIAGSTWAFIESGTRWIGDPKIGLSFITWGFCLLMVFLRVSAGWRGRKAALMAIAVLGCSAATWAAHIGIRKMFIQ